MTNYSQTRLNCYEKCPYEYKLKYVDRVRSDVPSTIEAFMGSRVHEALEQLYRHLEHQVRWSQDELLAYYDESWRKQYTADILIAKPEYTAENYRLTGRSYLEHYYERMQPFDQLTILGLETQDVLPLPDGNTWSVRIDKLAKKGDTYYVCDYKTEQNMRTQTEADGDRQLAMYALWVRRNFPDAKHVVLLWHMLKFDTDVTSERTDGQLAALEQDILRQIKTVESDREYPTNVSNLCNYCVYKSQCPAFAHESSLQGKTPAEFAADAGVQLVDRRAALDAQIKTLEQEQEAIDAQIAAFAAQHSLTTVVGTKAKATVKTAPKVEYPKKMEPIEAQLKADGQYDQYLKTAFDKKALTADIAAGRADPAVVALVTVTPQTTVTVRASTKDPDD